MAETTVTASQSEPSNGLVRRREWEAREAQAVRQAESSLRLFWIALQRDKLAMASALFLTVVVIMTIFAPVVAPYDPYEADPALRLQGFGTEGHILGLDGQGRDILSRLIYGARVSLPIALAPVIVATAISLLLGLIAGFYRRGIGEFIMRVLDVFYAFPTVMLAIAIAGILGPGMPNVMLSIIVVLIPFITRVVYTATMTIAEEEFIQAARACGASDLRIILHDVLPNVLSPVIVYGTTTMGLQTVFAAGLSFLGLGVQPPIADWGIMTAEGRSVLGIAPHVSAVPGVMLLLVALAFNLLGDGLRDALDPRLRQ
ncbi:ABC transporter permease [Rhodospirillaceae bacterium SYSU D60014]|uniref:ABC transporter permease n=1 Tax=Virgifigura deserti TaxID=2268457 RepID=UPI000E66B398